MANIEVTGTDIWLQIEMVMRAARVCFESFFSPNGLLQYGSDPIVVWMYAKSGYQSMSCETF